MKKELIQFILALLFVVVVGIALYAVLLIHISNNLDSVYASTKTEYSTNSSVSWTPEY